MNSKKPNQKNPQENGPENGPENGQANPQEASQELKKIVEAALLAATRPLRIADLAALFGSDNSSRPPPDQIRAALAAIQADCQDRGIELTQTASGHRFQIRQELAPWIARLWQEKPPKYSRALLETLAIIAYRQPVTRGEIEEIRGVATSSALIKTLTERDWIRVIGHRDLPGRPEILATTKQFLDHFNLRRLADLPPLSEVRTLSDLPPQLNLQPTQPDPETPTPEPTAKQTKPPTAATQTKPTKTSPKKPASQPTNKPEKPSQSKTQPTPQHAKTKTARTQTKSSQPPPKPKQPTPPKNPAPADPSPPLLPAIAQK